MIVLWSVSFFPLMVRIPESSTVRSLVVVFCCMLCGLLLIFLHGFLSVLSGPLDCVFCAYSVSGILC